MKERNIGMYQLFEQLQMTLFIYIYIYIQKRVGIKLNLLLILCTHVSFKREVNVAPAVSLPNTFYYPTAYKVESNAQMFR
jgi:hypothetical protein